jgi:hypothetical protein
MSADKSKRGRPDVADKGWKAFERRIASRVGGRRQAVTGEFADADVIGARFVYQNKLGYDAPIYLIRWMAGIVRTALKHKKIGVVVWKLKDMRDDNAMVLLRFKDWEALVEAMDAADADAPCGHPARFSDDTGCLKCALNRAEVLACGGGS